MNAERLLALFDRVADAPDAIPRLRRFVLDLAVRGRLVERDPADEPAGELVERLNSDNAIPRTSDQSREPRNALGADRGAYSFVPPPHWVSVRLIDIAQPTYGFAFPSSEFNRERRGLPLIRIRDIAKADTEAYYDGAFDPSYVVRAGEYLVGMDGNFNLRRWRGPEGLLNQRVMRITGWRMDVEPEFVILPLQMALDVLHGDTSQTTVKHLSARQVSGIEVPLPPLAEQRRIVVRVQELMGLLDKLEAAREEQDATRERLTASTVARLTEPKPSGVCFTYHARFAVGALPALVGRADQIKPLRQSILELAMRGKLVEQDPTDEPAAELLKRTLGARGGSLPAIPETLSLAEFDLPRNWQMSSLGNLALVIDPNPGVRQRVGPRSRRFTRAARMNRRSSRDSGCAYASGGLGGGW